MAKTHTITVRITDEQKRFIDDKIARIKSKVDVDVPAGLVVRKLIDRAIEFHNMRNNLADAKQGIGTKQMSGLQSFLQRRKGVGYENHEAKLKDFLKLIEEYNAEDTKEGE
ncbi:MAG: hypothetical protein EKK57_08140 [Proteobacteria bacterium]|nr:MAG: hypothetical protein EKK57_08140 [Pseudomonadota bacterium]